MSAFVVDSNCFIHLGSFGKENVLNFFDAQKIQLHVTKGVLDEIRTVRFHRMKTRPRLLEVMKKYFVIHDIEQAQIDGLASKIGERAAPQDVDVSLLVLSSQFNRDGIEVTLVTDDFKMANAATSHNLTTDVCPPSTFFERLQQHASPKYAPSIKKLAWKIRSAEMNYAISRKEQYNIQEKLTWLIESLIDYEPQLNESNENATSVPHNQETPSARKQVQQLHKMLMGGQVKQSMKERLEPLLPACESILPLYDFIKQVQVEQITLDLSDQITQLNEKIDGVYEGVGVELTTMRSNQIEIIQQYVFKSLVKAYMVRSLLQREGSDASSFLSSTSRALFYASLIDDDTVEYELLGTLALINIVHEDFDQASMCLKKSIELDVQGHTKLIHHRILHAICLFSSGKEEQASTVIQSVQDLVQGNLKAGANALFDLGKSLLSLGAAQLACEILDEAIECYTELEMWPSEVLDAYLSAHSMASQVEGSNQIPLVELLDGIKNQSKEEESKMKQKLVDHSESSN